MNEFIKNELRNFGAYCLGIAIGILMVIAFVLSIAIMLCVLVILIPFAILLLFAITISENKHKYYGNY